MSKFVVKLTFVAVVGVILLSLLNTGMQKVDGLVGTASTAAGQVKSCVIGGVEYTLCPAATETASRP